MFPFDFAPMLTGISVGFAFGLIGGISGEEKSKQVVISTFGAVMITFLGITFYHYGYSLDMPLEFLFWSCIIFIVTFLFGIYYHHRKYGGAYIGIVNS